MLPLLTCAEPEGDYPPLVQALVASMTAALASSENSEQARRAFQEASAAVPEIFFEAGCRFLESVADSPQRAKAYNSVFGCPAFLIELTRRERFSLPKLVEICRDLVAIDKRFDIRLAHLLPGRSEDRYRLEPEAVARILEVLNEVSAGPRLILLLSHLTNHPHPSVAEKATILMGRRVCNSGWSQRRLESEVPEIRAGVVQGLWGRNSSEARHTMRECLKDSSERVAGNAVFGLHLLGEADVPQLVENLMADERPPFRATAAWVAGQIGEPQYAELLMRAKDDSEASVRLAAKQALVKLRQEARLAEEAPKTEPAETQPPPKAPRPEPPAWPPADAESEPKPSERQVPAGLDDTDAATRWD